MTQYHCLYKLKLKPHCSRLVIQRKKYNSVKQKQHYIRTEEKKKKKKKKEKKNTERKKLNKEKKREY